MLRLVTLSSLALLLTEAGGWPGLTQVQADDLPRIPQIEMVRIPQLNIELGKYEVTQAQWKAVMGRNSSYFSACGDACPVEMVQWEEVQKFIRKLNEATHLRYRLPTGKEWEAACLAGKQAAYCGSDRAEDVAWYDGNSGLKTHPAGQKTPNAWGLYDMSGNVWEWTSDDAGEGYKRHVFRGGAWNMPREAARFDSHDGFVAAIASPGNGFRLARDL